MKAHAMEIKHFNDVRLFFFEDQYPSYDLFIRQISQVYQARNDEEILGEMIFLWYDEDNTENIAGNIPEFQYALERFDNLGKMPKFRIWFSKLPYNFVTSSFVDLSF